MASSPDIYRMNADGFEAAERAIRTAREYLAVQPDAEHTAAWGHARGVLEFTPILLDEIARDWSRRPHDHKWLLVPAMDGVHGPAAWCPECDDRREFWGAR